MCTKMWVLFWQHIYYIAMSIYYHPPEWHTLPNIKVLCMFLILLQNCIYFCILKTKYATFQPLLTLFFIIFFFLCVMALRDFARGIADWFSHTHAHSFTSKLSQIPWACANLGNINNRCDSFKVLALNGHLFKNTPSQRLMMCLKAGLRSCSWAIKQC